MIDMINKIKEVWSEWSEFVYSAAICRWFILSLILLFGGYSVLVRRNTEK